MVAFIMLKFGKIKLVKEKFYRAKIPIRIWDIAVDNIVFSKLIKTENNSKYPTGYFRGSYKTINFEVT